MGNSADALQAIQQHIDNQEFTQAISALKKRVTQFPQDYQAWLLLSQCLYNTGFYNEAVLVGQNAEKFDPLQQSFSDIQQLIQSQKFAQAETLAEKMLNEQPGHPRAIFTLAHLSQQKQDLQTSNTYLAHGLAHSPANLVLRQMYINGLESSGDFQQALDNLDTLVSLQKNFANLWRQINLRLKLGQHEASLDACAEAESLSQLNQQQGSQLQLARGQCLRILGKRDDSIKALKQSLRLNPQNADAWWALADMKNYQFTDQDKQALTELLMRPDVPQISKCLATFSLAKASESDKDNATTMALYNKANQLYNLDRYQPENVDKEFELRKQTFSKTVLDTQAPLDANEPRPIFILGLPRSGSTLVEQILASHSQIEGTFEQPTMACIERNAHNLCLSQHKTGFFSAIENLTPEQLHRLGQDYIKKGALFRQTNRPFFTDKQPFNFRHIGLIHKILPQALIIDVRRNPLDCGFSLYKQYFPSGVAFSFNLQHIAHFYNAYVDLMTHWETLIPTNIISVQYEELIQNPETQVRKLLKGIGLEYQQQCLNFYASKRKVHTASSEQVRQPINNKGIGSWNPFAQELQQLKAALDKKTLQRFSTYL
ncbi:tetratricopeptide repeat-containing sulfotransferase family protein [Glaciecola sp. 1036]|uniref:tetratricopeptide repeat-containing sulfotransferase family protein n=1 Tax=Alteromonadaceae TaxID=72275 RepID=UPI003D03E400